MKYVIIRYDRTSELPASNYETSNPKDALQTFGAFARDGCFPVRTFDESGNYLGLLPVLSAAKELESEECLILRQTTGKYGGKTYITRIRILSDDL